MARDEIYKQSAGSKKSGKKYKDIIKNGEFCLMICFEIVGKKSDRRVGVSWSEEIDGL
jgi:hypothetical protein